MSAAAVKRDEKQSTETSIFYLIDHPEEMDRFIRYIDEYYACFDRISEEVRNAVLAEMVMDKMSPTMEQLLEESDPDLDLEDIRSISPFTEEELFRGMLEVRRDIARGLSLQGPFEIVSGFDRKNLFFACFLPFGRTI